MPTDVARAGALPYLAGEDAERATALVDASRSGADILWMGRGGYGGARSLAHLAVAPCPLPLWGFSDGTALLGHWVGQGWPCWLAPPIVQITRLDGSSRERLARALAGEIAPFDELVALVPGRARGALAGGNLAVLASLVGTPHMPRLAGSILVLEDLGEVAYRIDRMLHQLLFAGAFAGVLGVVLGTFTGVSTSEARLVERSLAGFFSRLGLPCAGELPVGHGDRNAPLPLGRGWLATLEVGARGVLTVHREAA